LDANQNKARYSKSPETGFKEKMWVLIVAGVLAVSLTLAVFGQMQGPCAGNPKNVSEFEFQD
jgi:hypothetical protein